MNTTIDKLIKQNSFKHNNITMEVENTDSSTQILNKFAEELKKDFKLHDYTEGELMDNLNDSFSELINLVVHECPYQEVNKSCKDIILLCIELSELYRRKK